jgi:hypothetical protein
LEATERGLRRERWSVCELLAKDRLKEEERQGGGVIMKRDVG